MRAGRSTAYLGFKSPGLLCAGCDEPARGPIGRACFVGAFFGARGPASPPLLLSPEWDAARMRRGTEPGDSALQCCVMWRGWVSERMNNFGGLQEMRVRKALKIVMET